MREIKFRAWNMPFGPNGRFQNMVHGKAGRILTFAEMSPDEYIVEQYTGLKDVNGAEIYEGDILSYNERDIYTGNYHKRPLIVRFLDDSAMFDASGLLLWKVNLRSEVVGNVHENPELMEEQKWPNTEAPK